MDLTPYRVVFNSFVLVSAAISAFCWFMSARAEVPAGANTAGVGALLDGGIIIKNAKGDRVDLIDTMVLQSKWNRWAAVAATMSAGAQCLAAYLYPN